MDKNDIIDYVMHTPHNTNKAVLSGMLNQLTEGGGDILVATIHMDMASPDNISIDKTFDELKSAMQNGVPVYGRVEGYYNDTFVAVTNIPTINMNLLAQLGQDDKIEFETIGYVDDESTGTVIESITQTTYTLTPNNTLTIKIASIDLRNEG